MKAVGEASVELPWLAPCASSLAALTRPDAAAIWAEIRYDPGAVLLLCRASTDQNLLPVAPFQALIHDARVLELALRMLTTHTDGAAPWGQSKAADLHEAAVRQARLAHALAQKAGVADPDYAWVAGLLASLGRLTAAAVNSGEEGGTPTVDSGAISRRLCRAWQLPQWLGSILSGLDLPPAVAEKLGADPVLFRIVNLAVALLDEQYATDHGERLGALIADLELTRQHAELLAQQVLEVPLRQRPWVALSTQPLLKDLLRMALDQRRRTDAALIDRLHQECELLRQAIVEQTACEDKRLQSMKLKALAELAAGAGHEINNPLAVISGQAQYLLRHLQQAEMNLSEETTALGLLEQLKSQMQKPLQTIIGQTQRIHHVLTDLMQFARPSPPRLQLVPVAPLLQEVIAVHRDLAAQKNVQLRCDVPGEEWLIAVDLNQIRTVLGRLLENAIEAAPAEGWAGMRAWRDGKSLRIAVEDNGAGPDLESREHLFDPFYSGRSAGRGRGLGLSTAWRLAGHNGGEIAFDGEDGLTRFVLTLPLAARPERPASRNGHSATDNGHPVHSAAAIE